MFVGARAAAPKSVLGDAACASRAALEELIHARHSAEPRGDRGSHRRHQGNISELVERAAAYSGAADEELGARRIAEQEAQLELLTRQRDELAQQKSRRLGMNIKQHMEVIGADGVHIGTVDRVEGGRIKLTKADSGEGHHKGHHHFVDLGLVADVEGQKVRLSANAAVAVTLEEERSGKPT
jgi:hypothetical protein